MGRYYTQLTADDRNMIQRGLNAGLGQRVKFPAGQVVQAHSHPDDRIYTVISGTWYIGWGEKFDESKLTALPPGSLYTEPAKVTHFITTKEDVVVQVSGTGPTATDFVDPAHAPKK